MRHMARRVQQGSFNRRLNLDATKARRRQGCARRAQVESPAVCFAPTFVPWRLCRLGSRPRAKRPRLHGRRRRRLAWSARMRALLLTAPSKLEFVDFPDPEPAEDEVVVGIRACGICGSDI